MDVLKAGPDIMQRYVLLKRKAVKIKVNSYYKTTRCILVVAVGVFKLVWDVDHWNEEVSN